MVGKKSLNRTKYIINLIYEIPCYYIQNKKSIKMMFEDRSLQLKLRFFQGNFILDD